MVINSKSKNQTAGLPALLVLSRVEGSEAEGSLVFIIFLLDPAMS